MPVTMVRALSFPLALELTVDLYEIFYKFSLVVLQKCTKKLKKCLMYRETTVYSME